MPLTLPCAAHLQAYAAAFFAIPLFRSVLNAGRNAAIDQRNQARQDATQLLQRPDAVLQRKLAASQGQQRVITDRWGRGGAGDGAELCLHSSACGWHFYTRVLYLLYSR